MMILVARLAFFCFFFGTGSAQFSYDPDAANGPDHWADLELASNQCGGIANSPIAIETGSCDKIADYKFTPGSCNVDNWEVELKNNVVELAFPDPEEEGAETCKASTVQLPWYSGTFAIRQFHIHTSSEHTINGDFFGAELHLVHRLVEGTVLTVIGIPIQPDSQAENPHFAPILSAWKEEYSKVLKDCNIPTDGLFAGRRRRHLHRRLDSSIFLNPYNLIPTGASFYTYNGSLTTPPCTQGVLWNVVDTPLLVSVRQFQELSTIILGYRNTTTCDLATVASPTGSTSRPVQPLNGRRVVHICPTRYDGASSSSPGSKKSHPHHHGSKPHSERTPRGKSNKM